MSLETRIVALAQAIGADIKSLISGLSGKVDKVTGLQLSQESYTTAEKSKLGGVAAGATANPDTDSLAEGATNKYFLESRVRQTPMTGLAASNSAILGTDTPVTGLGKAQGQINALTASVAGKVNSASPVMSGAAEITTSGGGSALSVNNYSDNALSEILLAKSRGTLAAPTTILTNDRLGQFTFRGRNTTSAFNNSAALVVYAAEDFSPTGAGTFFALENTAAGSTARSQAVVINEFNNILLAVPRSQATGAKLDVGGNIRASGNVQVGGTAILDGPAGQTRTLRISTAGSTRWEIQGTADAETGSNAGSDLAIVARNDAGGYLRVAASLSRASGVVTVAALQVNGTLTSSGPVRLGQYTLTTLPSAAGLTGCLIEVTNATGGRKVCQSDGTAWKILNTTTTVS